MDQPTVLALHFVRSALVVIMVRLWAIAWGLSALACGLADETRAAADDVAVLRDLRYRPGSVQACTLDLAMPTERGQSPRPAIVVIHGGGWLEGDKSSFSTTEKRAPANILDFAKAGFVAVTINYRLSGEAPFP